MRYLGALFKINVRMRGLVTLCAEYRVAQKVARIITNIGRAWVSKNKLLYLWCSQS